MFRTRVLVRPYLARYNYATGGGGWLLLLSSASMRCIIAGGVVLRGEVLQCRLPFKCRFELVFVLAVIPG